MVATPLDFVSCSIARCASRVERVDDEKRSAPLVIEALACVCIVRVLPCAFWTLKSFLLSPAASNAFARYGASNETYRAR